MSREARRVTIARVRARWLVGPIVAAALGSAAGCHSTPAPASCPPAPVDPPCPDAKPSFDDVYQNVFLPTCVLRCHEPGGQESRTPLTSYQQVYGTDGTMAREIYFQVFQSCLMPPPGQPEVLTDEQRQKLLDWFGCGAPQY